MPNKKLEDITKVMDYELDFDAIHKEVFEILSNYDLNTQVQVGMTHRLGAEDEYKDCIGSLYDFEKHEFIAHEEDFTEFNSNHIGGALHRLYQDIGSIGRMRIMSVPPRSCYTMHVDDYYRLHVVLKTNENCHFLFPTQNIMYHMPCDKQLRWVDTREQHTFVNSSRDQYRVHIMLDVIKGQEMNIRFKE